MLCNRIITPYDADAFEASLKEADLTHVYPDLAHNIRFGFPIGDVAPISETYTPPNHFSVDEHLPDILKYFHEERNLGRMSGPFTKDEVENILGPFRTSPIQVHIVLAKDLDPEKKRICRNFSFKGVMGFSVNDCIDSDDYPTRWGSASVVEEIVSFRSTIYSP